MTHTGSSHKNTGLLVSVRSVEEALIAQSSGCVSIVDLKEPGNGALGCVSIETANGIANSVCESTILSIALGEAIDWPIWPSANADSRRATLSKFVFAKIGLARLANSQDWIRQWKDAFTDVPKSVERVAVAYADSGRAESPSVESILEAAQDVGCSVLLIDTFCKKEGGLLDHLSIEQLAKVVGRAREKNLKVVLAGSLTHDDIDTVSRLSPDFVAVRGAVCCSDRESIIDIEKVEALASLLSSCFSSEGTA